LKPQRFILAGPGAVGISLAAAWVRAGHRCVGIYGHGARGLARGKRLLNARVIHPGQEHKQKDFDVLLIAVPDDAIAAVSRAWSRLTDWKGKCAFHTSGALTSTLLAPLRDRGARVASLHPLTSVPRPSTRPRLFEGITFALEGDATACILGAQIVRVLGGRPLRIPRRAKVPYHLAACLSSGYLLAYLVMASELLDLPRERSLPPLLQLAAATLGNARRVGVRRSLTGPVVRGDLVTLGLHAKALRGAPPELGLIHSIVARKLLELVKTSGFQENRLSRKIGALLAPRSATVRGWEPRSRRCR
jgi:predicted short-subunit dehydrogenase-like oxidoreductase (DUF2520 family)